MNQERAEEILDYLLTAAYELDEAKAAAAVFEDQNEDAAFFRALAIKLNSELLQAIFDRFSDLLPFEEFPEINSSLRWDEVKLPPTAFESQLDEVVLSNLDTEWRKMAAVIWRAVKRSEELGLGITDEMFAARIQVLVDAGHLESQGDLRKWRHSEVRKKA